MALTDKLSAIGVAIREKTGKTELLTLDAMPTEIRAIQTGSGGGGDLPEGVLNFSGDISYLFRSGNWDWVIERYGNQITTNDITTVNYTFSNSNAKKIPFTLNFKAGSSYHSSSSTFDGMKQLTELPKVVNYKPNEIKFTGADNLRYIPDEWADSIDWSYMDTITSTYSQPVSGLIQRCFSLRNYPSKIFVHANQNVTSVYNCIYNSMCNQCYNLDEATDIPVWTIKSITSNAFSQAFNCCYRLKNVTFATDNGQPKVAQWSNQTIDLSVGIGLFGGTPEDVFEANFLKNSGLTSDTRVTDDASYQALKNSPDWWFKNAYFSDGTASKYSRYNWDSAVATINSLPDTSAFLASNGGTNTIKFFNKEGWGTDGGSFSTHTEEEIAVLTQIAADKGWTLTLV